MLCLLWVLADNHHGISLHWWHMDITVCHCVSLQIIGNPAVCSAILRHKSKKKSELPVAGLWCGESTGDRCSQWLAFSGIKLSPEPTLTESYGQWVKQHNYIWYFEMTHTIIEWVLFVPQTTMHGMSHEAIPLYQGSWGQREANLGPTGPRWAPCWPHELCYLGLALSRIFKTWRNRWPSGCYQTPFFKWRDSNS